MSKENVVAESWDDADADPVQGLMEKVEKVKILQRKEEKKEAFFEKVKSEENGLSIPKLHAEDGTGPPPADEPKRVFLRRPKDTVAPDTVTEKAKEPSPVAENQTVSRSRPQQKSGQKQSKNPPQTFEERQAAYQAARMRILGSEYKPDNQEIKEIKFIDRSKSPETLKMTEKNMVEHYGEELSRELMQQPEPATSVDDQFLPDFSFQQPPPCLLQNGSLMNNAPPGYPPPPPFFPPPQFQHQFMENQGFIPMSRPVASQYPNQGQQTFQNFVPPDNSAITSGSQANNVDRSNEQPFYYCSPPPPQQPQPIFQNYSQFDLPNMSYPPPNFAPQGQQSMGPPINQTKKEQVQNVQLHQQRQFINQNMNPSQNVALNPYQMSNGSNFGNGGSPPRGNGNSGTGRGKGTMPHQTDGNNGHMMKPAPMMYQGIPNGGQMNNGQTYAQRAGSNGQQRTFQQPNRQNGTGNGSNNMNRKQQNKNGNGKSNNYQNHQQAPTQVPMGQNPIPFGCPPRQVNAIREQFSNGMPPNTGVGILGPYPLMAPPPWAGVPNNGSQPY